ncbi:MAG TPA: L,D-transpeptidase family protein [Methyloceanibacter sp.]|jgi:L,D-transpeptidase YcbB|nr:L,D-transpeptidase family protein [Methyloceanibacter sp.]
MRRRSLIAALAAAASVFWLGAFALPPAFAQDVPAAEEVDDDPNAGAPQPADQSAATDSSLEPAAAPADGAGMAATAPQEAAAPLSDATPVVAAIRAKLADSAFRNAAPASDLAALGAFYNARGDPVWTSDMGFSSEAQAAIDEILKADDWGLSRAAFDFPAAGHLPDSVDEQALSEIKLNLAILKYARHARGGRTDPDKLKNNDMIPTFRDPKLVLAEIADTPAPNDYLRSLHPKHEQFKRLHQALLKARAESEAGAKPRNMQKLIVNMERWRWMPEDLGSLYVQINIPEYMAYIAKNGNVIHKEKVVVGKPVYATPIFSADLKSIVFNPEWTVPPTIIREDLLPRLRSGGGGMFGSGASVLKQHKLNVNYKGKRVDPSSIDWNRVNMGAISFTQAPGPTNVLGKVKFLYPNRHSVYMHDTIKRELLNREVRVEGHHCPRVANPGKVAAVILAEDRGMPASEIDKLLASGYNSGVALKGRVPVHTTYFTAVVDAEGNVKTYSDVYSLDAGVAAAILGKEAKAEAVADNADVAAPEVKPKPPTQPKPSNSSAPPSPGFAGAFQ